MSASKKIIISADLSEAARKPVFIANPLLGKFLMAAESQLLLLF
jgi:hypothetical protein